MTPAQHQLVARLVAVALVVGGVVAGWWAVAGLSGEAVAEADPVERVSMPGPVVIDSPGLSEAERQTLDTLRLQGGEAPAAPTSPVSLPPPQARAIKLLGTLVPSQGPAEGLFVDAKDRLVVAKPGQELPGGVRVESVSDGEATLSVNGRKVQLQTERKRLEAGRGGRP